MSTGTVKFFNDAKGFGFITEEGVDKDHFVHISGLVDEIREGDKVEFDLEEGKKGLNAVNVKVILNSLFRFYTNRLQVNYTTSIQ
jgi:CspA family cold shock protein